MARRDQSMIQFGDFEKGLSGLRRAFVRWSKEGRRRLVRAHKMIGQRHRSEAVKRVPVDDSRLKQSILTNTTEEAGGVLTETGTNVEYGVYLEFGTRHIAGGAVLALGESPLISDADAIHDWPAKSGEATKRTSAMMDRSGGAAGRLRNKAGQFVRGRPQEQMPWLRTSFSAIRDWAIRQIDEAYEPPAP